MTSEKVIYEYEKKKKEKKERNFRSTYDLRYSVGADSSLITGLLTYLLHGAESFLRS